MGNQAHVIVIGNEKGGSGKSTTAMHLVIGLLRTGKTVACIDLDVRQGTLTRYIHHRQAFIERTGCHLPMPVVKPVTPDANIAQYEKNVESVIEELKTAYDILVIDMPGTDSLISRLGHSHADTLITPMNDSLIDLDVLGQINPETMKIERPSHYAEMVWQQKMRRAGRDGVSIDWIIMRNRLSHLDARNKRRIEGLLADLGHRIGFRLVSGFGERVVYRELFAKGLTMMDLRDVIDQLGDLEDIHEDGLNMSHIAARQEVRNLIDAIKLN